MYVGPTRSPQKMLNAGETCTVYIDFIIWFWHSIDVYEALYSQYTPEPCEKNQQQPYHSGGIWTQDF